MSTQSIPLFYWSEIKFIFKDKENYGDLLSKYIVEKISGKPVKFVHPKKQSWYKWDKRHYLGIGSILHHATKDSIVWGSGIIDRKHQIPKADFRAVRGPLTRDFLLQKGYGCPDVYGDPAVLLPRYYNPHVEKSFELGIIPHYHDYQQAKEIFGNDPKVLVIDLMTMDVEEITYQILSCEKTISSSLHGIIVSHAYQIPSVWVKFSDKLFGDGIKFADYLESVGIIPYQPQYLIEKQFAQEYLSLFKNSPILPERRKVEELQRNLTNSCPFI